MAEELNEKDSKIEAANGAGDSSPDVYDGKGSLDHGAGEDIKITKDGVEVHPQPTADPLDPLNWTKWRKHVILAIVMMK